MLWSLAALLVSYGVGSLPLGGRLVALLSGQSPAATSAHNLGVENLLRFVGVPAALGSFLLDAAKGAASLALFAGSPWAALGVYAGHLYPLPRWRGEVPRGRGNGVLLGVLAGVWAYAGVPFWLTLLPLAVYGVLLVGSGYVALATTAGLVALPLVAVAAPAGYLPALLGLVLLGVWRHKVGLTRILDGTEAKLGDPPPVRGVDPRVVYAAFMIHPLTLEDVWQPRSLRWLRPLSRRGLLPEVLIRMSLRWLRPQVRGDLRGVTLADGRELRVMLIGGPMLPDQIRRYPDEALRMATQGARLAYELGAEAFGLGAFWSTVGDKGLAVQRAVPQLPVTNGGAYTAGTVRAALPGLLERFAASGRVSRATAAVVGANGVVAFGVARTVAPEVARLILIGRDAERLARSARTLARKYPQTEFVTTTDVARAREAELIFTATSDPGPVLYAEHVRPGAWMFDLGRPADAHEGVRAVPGVQLIPGGVVRPPGAMRSSLNLHFGDGLVPACLAETMIMTASRAFERRSLGEGTREADIAFYVAEGARLGFEVVTGPPFLPAPTLLEAV
ncbi:MAG: Acetylornithine aminotransferase [uncultured Truepera sp.]|uniref:Acetylornithine aminotransferase n=1 Tax=uncultured Truepera sp. TaxID=543023 RepID=A0A6J4VPJ2_9DEIN|nr:MAG: Acetylornithine aminotransferase [uncultured Truepera sp.]